MIPRLSVLTACYNDARFLAESVASALAQTVRAIEVVIVNDGSTDDTATVARSLAACDERVSVITLRENHGLAHALNIAATEARAPWLLKNDADDRILPTYVERILAIADAWDDVNCVFSPAQLFGARQGVYRYPEYDAARMIDEFMIPGPAAIRRDLFERLGGFDESMSHGEDWDFWVRASFVGLKPVQLAEPLWEYRQHHSPRMSDEGMKRIHAIKAHLRAHTKASVELAIRDGLLDRTGAAWR